MTTHPFILFPGPTSWRLGATGAQGPTLSDVAVATDAAPASIATAIAAALRSAGYRGTGVILAIPSAWCLCAPVSTTGLFAKTRRRPMIYRLEEKLPIAAEDVVADFVPAGPADDEVLGVCAQKSSLAPLVEALEENGVTVGAICPASLLALQQLLSNGALAEKDLPDAVLWPSELFILRNGKLHGWSIIADEPKAVLLHLGLELPPAGEGKSRTIAAIGVRPEMRAALSTRPDLRVIDVQSPAPPIAATSMANSILAGKTAAWIDLRRDALAVREPFRQVRTPLSFAMAAIVLCLICLCGAMFWRANRYDASASRFADEQQAAFRQAFPTGPAPADVRSRLEAEERRLRGLSGDASAPPSQEAGLVTLRDLITHLPPDKELRYRVLEVRLDQGRFTLEGQAAAHGDADSIVASLRRGGTFTVEPPRTEQLVLSTGSDDKSGNKGVAFTISGAVASEAPSARRAAK
jgi:hypothetical protein